MSEYADQRGHNVAWMTAAEREAIDSAAHIALDSARARQVRAFLVDRFGAGMVTDDMVRVTLAGLLAEEQEAQQ